MSIEPEDLPLDEEIETGAGVRVERRCFFKTAAAALGALAVPGFAAVRIAETDAELTLDEFVEEAVPVARKLVADTSLLGQDRYLLTLAAHAVRLADVPVPEFRDSGQGPGAWIGANGAPGPFVILHWKMDPGAEIRAHAHSYGNVVTLGLEGEALVDNFEVLGERDYASEGSFRVKRTVSQWLSPGDVNLVGLERNYVHRFRAGSRGARGLDITTRILAKRPTPYLRLGDPIAKSPDVFEGAWIT